MLEANENTKYLYVNRPFPRAIHLQIHIFVDQPSSVYTITQVTMIFTKAARPLLRTLNRPASKPYSTTAPLSDRIVIAVGGNALQRRGERLTIENMLKAAADMAPTIAGLARDHEVVLTHGNGPQVGELALERSAAT